MMLVNVKSVCGLLFFIRIIIVLFVFFSVVRCGFFIGVFC